MHSREEISNRRLRRSVLALVLTTAACTTAHAALHIEPELGVRAFTGDLARLLDPGVLMGVAVGVDVAPHWRVLARVDASFHPSAGDSAYHQVMDGVATSTSMGCRFLPLGRRPLRPVQPYVGADAGFTFLNWRLGDDYVAASGPWADNRDGIADIAVGGEVGIMVHLRPGWEVGAAARLSRHVSTDVPRHGYKSQAPNLAPGTQRRLEGTEYGVIVRVICTRGGRP